MHDEKIEHDEKLTVSVVVNELVHECEEEGRDRILNERDIVNELVHECECGECECGDEEEGHFGNGPGAGD